MLIFDRSVPDGDDSALGEPKRFYLTDLDHRSFFCEARWEDHRLSVDPPVETPVAIHLLFAARGFGPLWLTADNQGAGYVDDGRTRNLLAELATSQVARCRGRAAGSGQSQAVQELLDELPAGSVEGRDMGLEEAADLLGRALRIGEDLEHLLSSQRGHGGALLSGTFFGERRGPYAIGVGPDWPSHATPDFLRADHEWPLIAGACQATTLPSFWRWVEYQPGRFNWAPLDRIMEYAEQHDMRVKSFALYWGGIGSVPPWFRNLSYPAQKEAIRRWVETMVARYRGRISTWETVNEMHDWHFCNRFNWSHAQLLEVTRLVGELVGELDPGTPRLINHCQIWGEYLQHSGMEGKWNPRTYLEAVINEGIPFEAIGLQFYNPGHDMLQMALHLDRYIALGKRIYVTEMGTPSAEPSPEFVTAQPGLAAGWRDTWTLERQADWVDRFLTLATARPEVAVINYWDFDDTCSFVPSAGLLDSAGQPKPSYHAWLRHRPPGTR
ncbi:MAG TPA: endo-1,4-beta-xylanase [Chloroflexota bacterium]|nr:endo-1,4-beta-xylanase [Chloroflexota bacterium]